jgi:hypothetical protein
MHILGNIVQPSLIIAVGLLAACGEDAPVPPAPASLPELPVQVEPVEPPRGEERPVRELRIALVGEVRGEIEPCGCPTLPFGGFERRARLLETLRADPIPLLHFDAGETLLKGVATARSDASEDRAVLMLGLSEMAGVDAWAPGPTDLLALGSRGLQDVAAGTGPAPVSASWSVASGPLLPPSRVIERGGVRVGVVGLSGPPAGSRDRAAVTVTPPVDAARAAVATLPDDLDLVVVLGHLDEAAAEAVAAEVDGVGLVLTTRGREVDDPRAPAKADGESGALIVETPDRGRYLTVVHLRLGAPAGGPRLLSPPPDEWRARDTLREQLRNARAAGGDRVPVLAAKLEEIEARFAEVGRGRNLVYVRNTPLGADLDGASALAEPIDRFKARTVARAATAAQAAPTPLEPGYAASGACVNCHAQEFVRWGFTDHAKAWTSLVKREGTADPECVGCHSTGFGEPGGFGALTDANVRKYKAVQCEACHGPMRGHPDDARVHTRPVTEGTCVACHDAANSPDFDYGTYLRRATCQDGSAPPVP